MRKWWPLVAVCLGAFMLLVDITIVTVALPDMADDLGASFADLQWVMDGYALALAALLLGAGSLADLHGQRRVYVVGLVLFALASLACGLAPNAGLLVASRIVQGIGGAAMFATTMALLAATYRGKDLSIAFGVWGAVNGAAAAIGPILGGVLTEHLSWRAIFLVNLPISVVTIGLTLAVVGESRRSARVRLDLPGMVSFTVSAAAVVYGLIRAGEHGWTSGPTLAMFGVALIALVVFLVLERRRRAPLLDLGLFRRGSFVAAMLAGLAVTASAFAVLAYTSVWLQSVLGLQPVRAGLALVPMAVSSFIVAGLGGRFLHAVPARFTIGGGLLLIGIGSVLQSRLDGGSDWSSITLGLVVVGVGVGLAIPALSAAAMGAAPAEQGGMAAGALNTFRQLGFALGIAVFGLVFHTRVESGLRGSVPDPDAAVALVSGGRLGAMPGLAQAAPAAVADALGDAYLLAAAPAVIVGVLVIALLRGRPPVAQTGAEGGDANGAQGAEGAAETSVEASVEATDAGPAAVGGVDGRTAAGGSVVRSAPSGR